MLLVSVLLPIKWLLQAAGKATKPKDAGVHKKAADKKTAAKKQKTAAKKQQGAKATAKKGAAKK